MSAPEMTRGEVLEEIEEASVALADLSQLPPGDLSGIRQQLLTLREEAKGHGLPHDNLLGMLQRVEERLGVAKPTVTEKDPNAALVDAIAEAIHDAQERREPSGELQDVPHGSGGPDSPPPREPLLWAEMVEKGLFTGTQDSYRDDARAAIEAIGVLGVRSTPPEGEHDVRLTDEQIDILLSITGPRVADPHSKTHGDWSVDLQARLEAGRESQ